MGLLQSLGLRRSSRWESLTVLDHLLLSPLTLLAIQLYHLLVWLRGRPYRPPRHRGSGGVRVVCISDTHGQRVRDVPDGDVLVHAGDLTDGGAAADIQEQLDWLNTLPHAVKIVVGGNHDSFFDPASRSAEDEAAGTELRPGEVVVLQGESSVHRVREREICVFGAGDVPQCGTGKFAFQYTPNKQPWTNRVPLQTDILVTHAPPRHHLDSDLGCSFLLRELWRVKPCLHVFGHIHSGYGRETAYFDDMQAAYERLLYRPRRGFLHDLVPGRAWLDACLVVYHGLHAVAWKWLMGGSQSNQGSILVNAAQMQDSTRLIRSRAHVVDI